MRADKWVSGLTGKQILKLQDFEYLNEEDCETVKLHLNASRRALKRSRYLTPSRTQNLCPSLMKEAAFQRKMLMGIKAEDCLYRLRLVVRLCGYDSEKPFRILCYRRNWSIGLTAAVYALPSNGKREKFKLYAKEQRLMLYKEDEKDV